LRHSRLIILWATNTRLTNRHLWPTIEAARADGARVIVIDPVRTITADAADQFIQPLPGTDIALMLALMHVLIRDGLVDHEWVADHTVGSTSCRPRRRVDTGAGGRGCGLDAATVEALAHDYGTIRPAAIRSLIGGEHHTNGAMFYRTLAVLPAGGRGATSAAGCRAASARTTTPSSTTWRSPGPTCSPAASRDGST
jgi:anaerobic selenocysteine-containing dehydrogenase